MTIRVLVCDDQCLIRAGILKYLGADSGLHVVGQAADGTEAVLILTAFGEEDYVFRALQAGAADSLLKDAPPATLLTAIRVIARGGSLLDPAVTRSVVAGFVRSRSHRLPRTTETRRLTRRAGAPCN
jgi:DNA-binding NarL/FixJ family response regulator